MLNLILSAEHGDRKSFSHSRTHHEVLIWLKARTKGSKTKKKKEKQQRAAIVLAIAALSRETAFLFIDRRGQPEGQPATFVLRSNPPKTTTENRKFPRESKNSICNCFRWLSTCCYMLLIEGETKVNSVFCSMLFVFACVSSQVVHVMMHFLLPEIRWDFFVSPRTIIKRTAEMSSNFFACWY